MPPPPTPKMPPPNKEGTHKQPRETTLSGETGHGETGPRFMASRGGLSPGTWRCDPPPRGAQGYGVGGGSGALQRLVGAVLRLDELDDEEDDGLDAEHQHDAADEAGGVKSGGVKFGAAGQRGAGGAGPWGQGEQGGGGVWVSLSPPKPSPARIKGGFGGSEGGKAGMCPPPQPPPVPQQPAGINNSEGSGSGYGRSEPRALQIPFPGRGSSAPSPFTCCCPPRAPPRQGKKGKKKGGRGPSCDHGDRAGTPWAQPRCDLHQRNPKRGAALTPPQGTQGEEAGPIP